MLAQYFYMLDILNIILAAIQMLLSYDHAQLGSNPVILLPIDTTSQIFIKTTAWEGVSYSFTGPAGCILPTPSHDRAAS